MERYEKAAATFNDHLQAPFVVTGKVLRDRFNLFKDCYLIQDKKDAESTGVEQEVTELDKFLCDVVHAAVYYEKKASKDREETTRLEEKLVSDGESIRRMAMERRQKRPRSGEVRTVRTLLVDRRQLGRREWQRPLIPLGDGGASR